MIWDAQEVHFAPEMLANALDLEGNAWDEYVYSPTMWDDDAGKRRTNAASQSQTAALTMLTDMK